MSLLMSAGAALMIRRSSVSTEISCRSARLVAMNCNSSYKFKGVSDIFFLANKE
jgi:hypothetical protein